MIAVVLVGGFGTRLRPLTIDTPKQMLPVARRPMIEHVAGWLASHGVQSIVLSLGYAPDAFVDAFPAGVCAGVPVQYVTEPEPLDTAGAVAFAADAVGLAAESRFLVVNGDVLTDIDAGALVRLHDDTGAEATIALSPVEDPSRYGVVPTDADHRVVEFVEKPAPGTAPTNEINAGLYVFSNRAIAWIERGRRVSVERDTFPAIAAAGALYALGSDAYWIDTGTPETYLRCQLDLLDGRSPTTEVPPPISLAAQISSQATVTRSIVDDGCIIEPGASVIDSVLAPGAVVGAGATVRSSLLGPRSSVGDGAVVSACSVLGPDARIDPGERLHAARRPDSAYLIVVPAPQPEGFFPCMLL